MKPHRASRYSTDEERWSAVASRDPAADGVFYYSVRTTGVYCRPVCSARLARRENVRFHTTTRDAERAGFRPCKRCKPTEDRLAERRVSLVVRACRLIEAEDGAPRLDELAASVGMSRHHFHRLFKSQTGLTPKGYAVALRAGRVRRELSQDAKITDAIYGAGFNSSGRFYESSTEILGMTPTTFRAGGERTVIRFAVGECRLGSILVATSEKGICAILLGDDPGDLVRDLQDRFPKGELIGGDQVFEGLVSHVIGFVEAPEIGLDLPLDIRGTVFQRRVWDALREIPPGSTKSYTELAARIGNPKSVRAVARACGANSLAVAIPCHRVVRTDGSLSGYRWGIERKRELLRRERENGCASPLNKDCLASPRRAR